MHKVFMLYKNWIICHRFITYFDSGVSIMSIEKKLLNKIWLTNEKRVRLNHENIQR